MNPPFFWMKVWFLLKLVKIIFHTADFSVIISLKKQKKKLKKPQKIWIIF